MFQGLVCAGRQILIVGFGLCQAITHNSELLGKFRVPLGLKVTSGLDLGPGHHAHNVNINIIHGDSGSPSKRENGSTLERHQDVCGRLASHI